MDTVGIILFLTGLAGIILNAFLLAVHFKLSDRLMDPQGGINLNIDN